MSKESAKNRLRRIEGENRELCAYREAFFCLRHGQAPVLLSVGEGDEFRSVELLGASRCSGGVVLMGASVVYASDWLASVATNEHSDPFLRELARKVEKAIEETVKLDNRGKFTELATATARKNKS